MSDNRRKLRMILSTNVCNLNVRIVLWIVICNVTNVNLIVRRKGIGRERFENNEADIDGKWIRGVA